MAESYDDKIQTMINKRERIAAQKKARRQQELRKQYAILGGAILVVLIIVVLLFKGCSGDKKNPDKASTTPKATTEKVDENKNNDKAEATTKAADNAEDTSVPEETTTEETTTEAQTMEAGTGEKLYTTDVLNFRVRPSTDADLIIHIAKGEQVELVAVEGDWCKVNYDIYTGYVKYEYLSKEKPE